jgi:Tol biopolymer transport system component
MNADGSGQTRVTSDTANDFRPTWHPSGALITYRRNDDIYTIEPDGDNLTSLISRPDVQSDPEYSPDGKMIAFSSKEDGDFEIWVAEADGTNSVQLTHNDLAVDSAPSWSPDGTLIAFDRFENGNSQVFVMNADGSGEVMITEGDGYRDAPDWSPDGTVLAYALEPLGKAGTIALMDSDGASIRVITFGYSPDWQCISALVQGNLDCDDDVDSVDALLGLRHVASLPVNQPPSCPPIGGVIASLFGDVDCDDDIDSVDALKILRHVAALPVVQTEPCPDVGRPL